MTGGDKRGVLWAVVVVAAEFVEGKFLVTNSLVGVVVSGIFIKGEVVVILFVIEKKHRKTRMGFCNDHP